MSKPTQLSSSLVPGARNRYDDWVAVHVGHRQLKLRKEVSLTWTQMNQTLSIHATVRNNCLLLGGGMLTKSLGSVGKLFIVAQVLHLGI
jgi:hypothetical protein